MTAVAQLDSDEEFDQEELNEINDDIQGSPDFKRGGNARLQVDDEAL
jgi:hypothetical protein